MAWATLLMKLRKALVEHAGEIYARRNPPASGENPIKGEDLSPAQLGVQVRERIIICCLMRAYERTCLPATQNICSRAQQEVVLYPVVR